MLSDAALETEIRAIRRWLEDRDASTRKTARLRDALQRYEAAVRRRGETERGRDGPSEPRSLDRSVDPSQLSDAELDAEIRAVRQYLDAQNRSSPELERLRRTLFRLQRAADRRTALEDRLESFKQRVKTAARLRLEQNRSALAEWKTYVRDTLSAESVATGAQVGQTAHMVHRAEQDPGARGAVRRWLQTPGPHKRQVLDKWVHGDWQACTGCHAMTEAAGNDEILREYREMLARPPAGAGRQVGNRSEGAVVGGTYMSPLERTRRVDPSSASAPPGSGRARGQRAGRSAGLGGTIGQARSTLKRLDVYRQFRRLGPDGYEVLPSEVLASSAPPGEIRDRIITQIEHRRADYAELRSRIAQPDFSYLRLRPMVQQLLPTAATDVQSAVREEMLERQVWNAIYSIGYSAATIASLLLSVFPPAGAAARAGAVALRAGVAAETARVGWNRWTRANTLSLGRGADRVFSPKQQDAADHMLATSMIELVMASVDLGGLTYAGINRINLSRARASGSTARGELQGVTAHADGNQIRLRQLDSASPQVTVRTADGAVVYDGSATQLVGRSRTPPSRQLTSGKVPPSRQLTSDKVPPSRQLTSEKVPPSRQLTSEKVPPSRQLTTENVPPTNPPMTQRRTHKTARGTKSGYRNLDTTKDPEVQSTRTWRTDTSALPSTAELRRLRRWVQSASERRVLPQSERASLPSAKRSEAGQTYATSEQPMTVAEDQSLPGGGVRRQEVTVRHRKTTAAKQSSGASRPYRNVDTEDVDAYLDRMKADGIDPNLDPQSKMHAEVKHAVTNPNAPMAVDRPMCPSCQKFMRGHAQFQDKIQVVTDPVGTHVFYPDGSVVHRFHDGTTTTIKASQFE